MTNPTVVVLLVAVACLADELPAGDAASPLLFTSFRRNGEDGVHVAWSKDETRHPPAKNLRVAMADSPAGPYGPPSAPITGKYWAEGPTAIKLGEKWFVYFDRYTEHRYGLATSKDLVHWDDESDKVRFPADHRHGSVLRVSREVLEGLMRP